MALAALSGAPASVPELIHRALLAFVGVRNACDSMTRGLLAGGSARRAYVAARLPYGAKLRLPLGAYGLRTNRHGRKERHHAALVRITMRTGTTQETQDTKTAAQMLAARVEANPDAAVRILMAIERARKQVLALAEENTRWQT